MKKQFTETEGWKWLRTLIEILAIIFVLWLVIQFFSSLGISEAKADSFYETMYVMCDDYVNVRVSPNKKQEPIGRLETGDAVTLDGKKKNGYVHVIDLLFEECEGWVHVGFLVPDKPETENRKATIVSKGRLAARKYINGRRTRWLKPGATVTVWYWSDDWALTNCGYIQSKYLELE